MAKPASFEVLKSANNSSIKGKCITDDWQVQGWLESGSGCEKNLDLDFEKSSYLGPPTMAAAIQSLGMED
jgi:hypothetical protein